MTSPIGSFNRCAATTRLDSGGAPSRRWRRARCFLVGETVIDAIEAQGLQSPSRSRESMFEPASEFATGFVALAIVRSDNVWRTEAIAASGLCSAQRREPSDAPASDKNQVQEFLPSEERAAGSIEVAQRSATSGCNLG
jgi:hypothetical protein